MNGTATQDQRAPMPALAEVALQFALVFGAALAYFAVRGVTEGGVPEAVAHGFDLYAWERSLGIDVELWLQSLVLRHHWIVTLGNWVYIWGHWPVIAASLFWLHHGHRREYRRLRNGLFLSGAIGLVIFALYPVAPPRLVPLGIVDTVTDFSTSYRLLQPPALVNKYAALPSLHAGWNAIVGVVVFQLVRHPLARAAALTLPVLMSLAVVVTGNHYVLDVAAGIAVATTGLALASIIERRRPTSGAAPGPRPVALGPQLGQQAEVVEDHAVHAARRQPVDRGPVGRAPGPDRRCATAQSEHRRRIGDEALVHDHATRAHP